MIVVKFKLTQFNLMSQFTGTPKTLRQAREKSNWSQTRENSPPMPSAGRLDLNHATSAKREESVKCGKE